MRRRRRKEDFIDLLFTLGLVNGWLVLGIFIAAFGLSVLWWWHYTPDASMNFALATLSGYVRWLAAFPPLFAILFTWILVQRGFQRELE